MLILSAIVIVTLIFFTIRMSHRVDYKTTDPSYKEYFIWNNEIEAMPLLLHSLNFKKNSFSGYSRETNSVISFNINSIDRQFIKSILASYNFTKDDCSSCHTPMESK